jgi:hypothetical protein
LGIGLESFKKCQHDFIFKKIKYGYQNNPEFYTAVENCKGFEINVKILFCFFLLVNLFKFSLEGGPNFNIPTQIVLKFILYDTVLTTN